MPPRRHSNVVPNAIQLKCIKCVQIMFAKQHFKQLKLDCEISIDHNSKICMECDANEIDNRSKNEVLALLKEQRVDIFLHSITKLVSSNRFIGLTLIQSILEMILTTSPKHDETSAMTLQRIQSASMLFENILDNFPPSWPVCFGAYKNLLYSPINIEIDYKKIRMTSSDGFLPIILALLEDAFKDADNNDADSLGFDSMMNFQQYERLESSKCSYVKLTRNEKIDRLFVVLNLLVKMMEIDLSIWIQRYPFQTKIFMSNKNTRPLIGHFLWKGKECGEVNMLTREVLRIFTMSIWIDFPNDKTDILARLVQLMAVAVNLCENYDMENLISYPNIKRLTKEFASDMSKSIESYPYTIDFYLKVIRKIRSPVICMLVSARLLNKFSKEFENISVQAVVLCISNGSYKQYKENVDTVPSRRSDSGNNYPAYDPRKYRSSSKHLIISRDEYLSLVLHLFQSYIEIYRTNDLLDSLLSKDDQTSSGPDNQDYDDVHRKVQNERNHRMDFDSMSKDWKKLKSAAKEAAAIDTIPVAPTVVCRNVYLDPSEFERFTEDLKYLLELEKIVDQSVHFGDAFKKFVTAVKQCLSTSAPI